MERLLNCESVIGMKEELLSMVKSICEFITSKKKNHNELIDKIIVFVQQNYSNTNLSISMIGENFDRTPAYLSNIFKQETGEGLLDYINKTRLKNAKILLKQEEITIGETATKVGFISSGSLIRAFRKYEGITPGKFKEK